MKKKLIIKLALIVLLLGLPIVILLSNTKEAEANTCSKTVTYYFLKGIDMTDRDAETITAHDETTFELPNEWGTGVSISNVDISYNWDATDTKNYYSNQKASNCTTGLSTAWCDPTDTQCLNSGNGQDYVWTDCDTISVSGSGDVSIGGVSSNDFVDNYFVGANESGTEVNFTMNGNEIYATIDRNWDQSATDPSKQYYDGKWMFQPVKADITYTGIPCDEEEEEPKRCTESSGSTIAASGCSGYHYSSSYNKAYNSGNLVSSQTIANACSDVIISGSGVMTFTENGTLNVGVNPREQYAGGGFAFNLGYSGSASKSFCREAGQEDDVTCSCSVKTYQLVQDGCKTDADGKCLKDSYGHIIYDYTEECLPATCSCTDADKAAVKSQIESLANGEFGSPTANPSVKSQDSNNEKDLAVDKTEIGTVSAGGGGGSSWVRFTQSHACIELREVVKDGVTYPAYVTYKDTCNVTNPDGYTGEMDGGYKYYIPIKYADGTAFYVESNSNGLINVLKGNNWSFDLSCSVDVTQKLYEEKGYKFIYRPIDMSNPFPKTINSDREIGSNWVKFMEDEEAKEDKLNRKTTGLEYSAILNSDILNNIKSYNNTTIYPGLETINNSGRSQLLLNNGILNVVEKKLGTTYNSLGECTEECW